MQILRRLTFKRLELSLDSTLLASRVVLISREHLHKTQAGQGSPAADTWCARKLARRRFLVDVRGLILRLVLRPIISRCRNHTTEQAGDELSVSLRHDMAPPLTISREVIRNLRQKLLRWPKSPLAYQPTLAVGEASAERGPPLVAGGARGALREEATLERTNQRFLLTLLTDVVDLVGTAPSVGRAEEQRQHLSRVGQHIPAQEGSPLLPSPLLPSPAHRPERMYTQSDGALHLPRPAGLSVK